MRMIIYSEIGGMYSSLVHFHDVRTGLNKLEEAEWKKKQLRERFLKFEGEKYADEHKDIFIQLKERPTINLLYSAIRDVFGSEEDYGFDLNSGLAIEIIEDCVRLEDLPPKFVNRYMNDSDVSAISKANKKRLALHQAVPKP